ncbi:hypothetical protein M438DRAFT_347173 [Aureobasidium pullulans EXF-150]|uniref:Uncharacterized protein n=1 Tax=Aureobasidium pullulans EXF-150 TaxID=1043002 RepID=A0A074Y651_AURPU|nr:uncharacterized protein M438DRAFT_347173 [Aureobasidium pullulans EXF-150]KEQ82391.1 hypothetical protein M438DRAFT_347173 [Aureobasidium pullulans EXF-150]
MMERAGRGHMLLLLLLLLPILMPNPLVWSLSSFLPARLSRPEVLEWLRSTLQL